MSPLAMEKVASWILKQAASAGEITLNGPATGEF
jgi:hypothetical protein